MSELVFTDQDYRQMDALEISKSQVQSQVETFKKADSFVHLGGACKAENGVIKIPQHEMARYLRQHEKAAQNNRFMKFVPASGAATRMFQALLAFYNQPSSPVCKGSHLESSGEFSLECRFLRFMSQMQHFAFFDDLEAAIIRDGLHLGSLIQEGCTKTILSYLLTDQGLGYAGYPKGLIKFHRYPSECRTPFEEHLVEAAHYLIPEGRVCDIHFTVSPEHEQRFGSLLERVRSAYEERYGVRFNVCFSVQKPSTNTIAVDAENRPFRDASGRLLFRPGGHGALIENMNDLRGDLVYVKNIDNVVPDRLKETTGLWKKLLGGYLAEIEESVHRYVRRLKQENSMTLVQEAAHFARERLFLSLPTDFREWLPEKQYEYLLSKLNRPIRVCGVVQNEGEPGGAPFWVKNRQEELSLQIVESAQVNFAISEQRDIWSSSTHFNPVDLVCALRDHEGRLFDLRRYTDPEAVFISSKSKDGKELKALELPGLWNGAMADWTTLIVEVPKITFNPVKTTCDLLRPEHQPELYVMDDSICYGIH